MSRLYVLKNMRDTMLGYWREAEGYQQFAYWVGIVLLASAFFHAGVLVVTNGSLQGDVSWRKPILFGEAFGLTTISVAWFMTFLTKRRVVGWLLLGLLAIAYSYEVFWVSLQQWRGVPSHFNTRTPFDGGLFAIAGSMIFLSGAVLVVITVWSFFSLQAPASLKFAIRAGLVLLLAAQAFGFVMIINNGNTIGAAGAMKIPHALALHAPQILPALAWLLSFTDWSEGRRTRTVILAIGAYGGLVGISASQALRGRAPLDLGTPALLLATVCELGLLALYAQALAGLASKGPLPGSER